MLLCGAPINLLIGSMRAQGTSVFTYHCARANFYRSPSEAAPSVCRVIIKHKTALPTSAVQKGNFKINSKSGPCSCGVQLSAVPVFR